VACFRLCEPNRLERPRYERIEDQLCSCGELGVVPTNRGAFTFGWCPLR
jgi:hypothetical protein